MAAKPLTGLVAPSTTMAVNHSANLAAGPLSQENLREWFTGRPVFGRVHGESASRVEIATLSRWRGSSERRGP
ncbi:hypothetical protein [Candidatus Mycobacterium methanotrophicum]|uniref:Uncharacterized protein n=1 Tax=Candidatus Mycobacterium methanotrophicum TaxID=2943498 RepID=A0ABY4QMH7_9MYCO|nr:hypothetical protein [Candidatus Mycobacterium methanotrophicum]UQX11831.1 hypothetical protein M5I08_05275 [Candidatus Mycobacterium methanotrophicum]